MTQQIDELETPSSAEIAPLTLGDIQGILARRWLTALICGVAAAVFIYLATASIVPLYEAKAVLTIDFGPRTLEFQRDPDSQRVEINMLNTIRDQIVSVPVLRATLEDAALINHPVYATAADPVGILRDRVKATTAKDSLSISLSLRDESRDRAIKALESLIGGYQGKLQEAKADKSQNAVLFLRDQRDAELAKLTSSRQAETEFMNANNLVSTNPDINPLSQRLLSLNAQLVQVDGQLSAGQATASLLEQPASEDPDKRLSGLLAIDEIARQTTVIDRIRATNEMTAQVDTLANKYGERHARMGEARASLANQRALLLSTVDAAANVIRQNREALRTQAKNLQQLISEQEVKLKEYRTRLLDLGNLSEVTDSRNKLYQTIVTRLNEMEVDRALDEKRTKIIDPPTASSKPANVKPLLYVGLAILVGAVAAIGGALATESFDVRLQGARQIQQLTRLPMLGSIPSSKEIYPLGRTGDPDQPHFVAEAFRHLRAALRLARRNPTGCEKLAIMSCTPGEGKSTTAARLAISLSSMGARVLLIDADMRKPTQDDQLGEHTERGLSLLLADEKGIMPVSTSRPGLDYLGAGVIPPNPGELLLAPRFAEVLAEYEQVYDYILIDTPPLSLVADSLSIAEHMDGLILVLRDGYTDKDMLRLVLARVAPVADRMLGFVLNGDRSRAAGYYGKKYAYGYGAGPQAAAPTSASSVES